MIHHIYPKFDGKFKPGVKNFTGCAIRAKITISRNFDPQKGQIFQTKTSIVPAQELRSKNPLRRLQKGTTSIHPWALDFIWLVQHPLPTSMFPDFMILPKFHFS